jgi:hypothetical protein
MQSFLTTVGRLMEEKRLPALMIGGHAVTALGHPRATFDLDLLVPRSSVERWRLELAAFHYRIFHESRNFLQFESSPELPLPPLDLMVVEDEVFDALDRSKTDLEPIATPGVKAMIALKLHAIQQPARGDSTQDWADVMAIIRAHQLTLDDPEFSTIVRKHGGETAIERIRGENAGGH